MESQARILRQLYERYRTEVETNGGRNVVSRESLGNRYDVNNHITNLDIEWYNYVTETKPDWLTGSQFGGARVY